MVDGPAELDPRGRGHLRREGIVHTALALMNRIGLDALTLRRLAVELDVQAPALYWHFKNKQELLNEMAELMLRSIDAVAAPVAVDWAEWLLLMGNGLRDTLLHYRDGARLLAVADVSKSAVLGLDMALGVLVNAGFDYQTALVGVMTVVNYTLGLTFEEQSSTGRTAAAEYFRDLVTSNHLPYVTAAFEKIGAPPDSATEFNAGLRLIIAGLRTQHPQATGPRRIGEPA